jgi:hypothetical protein
MTEAAITPAEAPAAEEAQAQHAEKTYTQADIDRIIGERIAGVKSKYADYEDAKKAAAELAELKAAQMSEADKAKAEADALRKELDGAKAAAKAAELAALRLKVAAEKNLNPKVAPFLLGDDEEAIANAADIIAAPHKPSRPGGGSNPPDAEGEAEADAFKSAFSFLAS